MCTWRPWRTALGGLPNISFVVQKPEPSGKDNCIKILVNTIFQLALTVMYKILGTEFKTVACTVKGIMCHMEIQYGKDGMKSKKFNSNVGATTPSPKDANLVLKILKSYMYIQTSTMAS